MNRDLLLNGAKRLADAGIDSGRLDARVLQAHAASDAEFETYIERRIAREPVAYITGVKEFWSLDFAVGPGVLVPRPETETLVEQAQAQFPDRDTALRIADFGVGSGAMLLAFLSEYPKVRGIGVDSSAEALGWATRNAAKLGLAGRCELRLGDWSSVDGTFDVVFSNPPYLTAAEVAAAQPELHCEPVAALDGGADGLNAYRALGAVIASHLNKSGFAFVEIGFGQSEAVSAIFRDTGLEIHHIAPDLAGIPRCVVTRLAKNPWKGAGETVVSSRGTENPT